MHQLSDTAGIVLRTLDGSDWGAVRRHLLRLATRERQERFGHLAGDDSLRDYCDHLERSDAVLVGAYADGEIRGLAELVLLDGQPAAAAELAVSVHRSYQSRGIGTAIIARALTLARERGIHLVSMKCRWGNRRMRRLAKALGARVSVRDGEVDGVLRLQWPTAP